MVDLGGSGGANVRVRVRGPVYPPHPQPDPPNHLSDVPLFVALDHNPHTLSLRVQASKYGELSGDDDDDDEDDDINDDDDDGDNDGMLCTEPLTPPLKKAHFNGKPPQAANSQGQWAGNRTTAEPSKLSGENYRHNLPPAPLRHPPSPRRRSAPSPGSPAGCSTPPASGGTRRDSGVWQNRIFQTSKARSCQPIDAPPLPPKIHSPPPAGPCPPPTLTVCSMLPAPPELPGVAGPLTSSLTISLVRALALATSPANADRRRLTAWRGWGWRRGGGDREVSLAEASDVHQKNPPTPSAHKRTSPAVPLHPTRSHR